MSEIEFKVYPLNDRYSVSKCGCVRNNKTGRVIAGTLRPDGYRQINVAGTLKLLHVMILETFVGPRPAGMLGLHRDDDRSRNVLENVEWGTYAMNARQRVANGRARGRNAAAAKLNRDQVLAICRRLDAGERMRPIASDYGVAEQLITKINTGYAWQWLTGRTPANGRIPSIARKV